MSDTTPRLALPYLMPDQAQKHVTHNEALQRIDAACQLILADILAAPPADLAALPDGRCYGIDRNATGAWAGFAGQVALLADGDWQYLQPARGWLAYIAARSEFSLFDGSGWVALPLPGAGSLQTLGINAAADAQTRLAVSAAASLFSHAGAGHQLKINRAAENATASLLLQTGFSGRAEFGLAGDLNVGLKVSQNGASWRQALVADMSGVVRQPERPVCRAALNPATLSPANGSQSGFQTLSVAQGGFSLGAALPAGQKLVVPANGLYRLTLQVLALSSSGHGVAVILGSGAQAAPLKGNAALANCLQTAVTILPLAAQENLALVHTGIAQLDFGPGKTELMAEFIG